MTRCLGVKKNGQRCTRQSRLNNNFCWQHQNCQIKHTDDKQTNGNQNEPVKQTNEPVKQKTEKQTNDGQNPDKQANDKQMKKTNNIVNINRHSRPSFVGQQKYKYENIYNEDIYNEDIYNESDSDDDVTVDVEEYISGPIKYDLYPFNRGEEIQFTNIVDSNFSHVQEDIRSKYMAYQTSLGQPIKIDTAWKWEARNNILTVFMGSIPDGVIYYVTDQERSISSFVDRKFMYRYQSGNGYTSAHLTDDGDFIIENFGDVSSVVILKYQ